MPRFSVLFLIAKLALAQRPDLVLLNAQVVTMNEKQPLATAVAISGGRISWVGETSEAGQRFAGARTLDLSRATVLPGIIDAHTHLLSLGESLLKLNLKDAATPEQAAERVRERARSAAPGQWILGWGWDEGAWAAHYPTHQILSEAAPDNPVLLTGLHSFASWVNRKALQAAGITRDTKDPPNGKIIRDVSGEPTGVLTDRAQALVSRLVPPPTREETKRAIAIAAEECLRHGLTSLHEARVSAADLDAYRELIREGKLRLRIYAMLDGANAALIDEWLKHGPEIDRAANRLTVRCVKVFADGALGSRGAALFEPYSDAPDRKGVVTTPEPELYRMTRRCLEAGFQVATHAIGDAANHFVLNAYERALKETHASGARLRIEHAQVLCDRFDATLALHLRYGVGRNAPGAATGERRVRLALGFGNRRAPAPEFRFSGRNAGPVRRDVRCGDAAGCVRQTGGRLVSRPAADHPGSASRLYRRSSLCRLRGERQRLHRAGQIGRHDRSLSRCHARSGTGTAFASRPPDDHRGRDSLLRKLTVMFK